MFSSIEITAPEAEVNQSGFYCIKPSDIPCHKQCVTCMAFDKGMQPNVSDTNVGDIPQRYENVVKWRNREISSLQAQLAAKEKEIHDYRKALIDIRGNGGGKLCREDRSRMGKIAFDVLSKYPSQTQQ